MIKFKETFEIKQDLTIIIERILIENFQDIFETHKLLSGPFNSEVQHWATLGYTGLHWATLGYTGDSKNTSLGVWYSNTFLGLLLSFISTRLTVAFGIVERLVALGMYCLVRPLVCSFKPRCQEQ